MMNNNVDVEVGKHKHIVVSGDNGNALGVVRSIAEGGINPILIYLVEETHLPCLIKSKYLTVVHKVNSYEDALDLLIDRYGMEDSLPFVYTCDDSIQSLVDKRYDELAGRFYFFNSGGQGRVNHLMNKHTICEIAEKCGCTIPKQEVVDTGNLPNTLQYPIITKTLMSIMGAWKDDVYICHDENELKRAYQKIKSPKLLLQEYIYKKNELTIQGLSIDGGREVYPILATSYFRCSEQSYGGYMYCKPLDDEQLAKQITSIIGECKYTGCFEIEFLIDDNDKKWFLEVNFRYSFWNYAVTFGGINYPLTWARSVLDNCISRPEDGMLKSYFTAMSEPGDYGQSVVSKNISLKKWLKDLHNADMLYFYNPKDPMPAYSFWFHKFFRKLRRFGR